MLRKTFITIYLLTSNFIEMIQSYQLVKMDL